MFKCAMTGQTTLPRQKMKRVIMGVRPVTYTLADGTETHGNEITWEVGIAADPADERKVKPLIVHEGKDQNKAIDTYRHRALAEARTVYLTSVKQVNGRDHVRPVLEIGPHGDIREIPPLGLAVGAMDHTQAHFMHWAEVTNSGASLTKQALKHIEGLAGFVRLNNEAKEMLKVRASS